MNRNSRVVLRGLVCLVGLGVAGDAHAINEGWHIQGMVRTTLPMDVGVGLEAEGPLRSRGEITFGVLPDPYLSLVNDLAAEWGGYDEYTEALIANSLDTSFVLHAAIGWRPLKNWGFVGMVGYDLVVLGGGLSPREALEAALDSEAPVGEAFTEVDLGSTLHLITVDAGWEWVVNDWFVVRVRVGGAFTAAARASVEPDSDRPAVETLATEGEDYLQETYTRYVHTPTVGVGVGWRFF